MREDETLDDLDVFDVFQRCLDAHDTAATAQQEMLQQAFRETVASLQEDCGAD